ncbi:unnamed protein product [Protopolystoma xenopodis]|uniref:Uncharacterized protein n=1 Tax=Protopolystoma xenopodis TaxID=117903 RepID=A0A3S4ZW55_9PLAT|nr:unnamed protein product [Protopolystoma xenopodis]
MSCQISQFYSITLPATYFLLYAVFRPISSRGGHRSTGAHQMTASPSHVSLTSRTTPRIPEAAGPDVSLSLASSSASGTLTASAWGQGESSLAGATMATPEADLHARMEQYVSRLAEMEQQVQSQLPSRSQQLHQPLDLANTVGPLIPRPISTLSSRNDAGFAYSGLKSGTMESQVRPLVHCRP